MKTCKVCEKKIELWISKGDDYIRNQCSRGDDLCLTMIDEWREYWTEKYQLAKLRERVEKYSKGIKE